MLPIAAYGHQGNHPMPNRRDAEYDVRCRQVFGSHAAMPHRKIDNQSEDIPATASGAEKYESARPTRDRAAGPGMLLSAEDVVHDLLNLPGITDPGRWLRRHGAPVALDTGHAKRYLAAQVIPWAAEKFASDEASRTALLALTSTHSTVRTD